MDDMPATSPQKTLLIAGASGLVGRMALQLALDHPAAARIVSLGRRRLPLEHPKLEQTLWDFTGAPPALPPAEAAICALGTTMAKAGSRRAFHAIDHDAVLAFAGAARAGGAQSFAVVSSVGASARTGNFYLATKGRMEDGLQKFGFARLAILRPSFLVGQRGERRLGEGIALFLAPYFNPLLGGRRQKYRAIDAAEVAAALLAAAIGEETIGQATAAHGGILEYGRIRELARTLAPNLAPELAPAGPQR